ncbi:hypothetical protein C8R47DRAFT_748567 [Mycena vitilis]|nr:hypothetical protein C8R47DRAFT_748567 [Mycena vitilis]
MYRGSSAGWAALRYLPLRCSGWGGAGNCEGSLYLSAGSGRSCGGGGRAAFGVHLRCPYTRISAARCRRRIRLEDLCMAWSSDTHRSPPCAAPSVPLRTVVCALDVACIWSPHLRDDVQHRETIVGRKGDIRAEASSRRTAGCARCWCASVYGLVYARVTRPGVLPCANIVVGRPIARLVGASFLGISTPQYLLPCAPLPVPGAVIPGASASACS